MTEIPREERTPYFACTACGLIGEPDSADYTLTVDRGHVDWTRPMNVGCGFCRTQTRITSTDVLDRDTEHACSRCGIRTACPAQQMPIESSAGAAASTSPEPLLSGTVPPAGKTLSTVPISGPPLVSASPNRTHVPVGTARMGLVVIAC